MRILTECFREPEFRFPSNGKVYLKPRGRGSRNKDSDVSIPFKRERLSQEDYADILEGGFEFPFPSNGKDYRKDSGNMVCNFGLAMFPFPSNGKDYRKPEGTYVYENTPNAFPFPSNGNAYHKLSEITIGDNGSIHLFPFPSNGNAEHKQVDLADTGDMPVFPFPSNGNAQRKRGIHHRRKRHGVLKVSIPFKWERTAQARFSCNL